MRSTTALLLGLVLGLWGGAVARAQGAAKVPACAEGVTEPEVDDQGRPTCAVLQEEGVVALRTSDGWTLKAKWVPPPDSGDDEGEEEDAGPDLSKLPADLEPGDVPGLDAFLGSTYKKPKVYILLHMEARRREDWYQFGKTLQAKGFGWLALDLRGHGGSLRDPEGAETTYKSFRTQRNDRFDNEWNHMTRDVDAGLAFLQSLGFAAKEIGFIGGGVGASIALKAAALRPEVNSVILLSPGLRHREVLSVNPMRSYGKRPLLMVLATANQGTYREGLLLGEIFKKAADPRYLSIIEVLQGYGTRLLLPGTVLDIMSWIENPIRAPDPAVSTSTARGTAVSTATGVMIVE